MRLGRNRPPGFKSPILRSWVTDRTAGVVPTELLSVACFRLCLRCLTLALAAAREPVGRVSAAVLRRFWPAGAWLLPGW